MVAKINPKKVEFEKGDEWNEKRMQIGKYMWSLHPEDDEDEWCWIERRESTHAR